MRRCWLALLAAWMGVSVAHSATDYAPVVADTPIRFPVDFGSHPGFRTEWWYVTGWLRTSAGEELGFQITFFRTKPQLADDNPSAFSPRQILIAHCALSDPKHGRLWQDQKIRRAGMGLAQAAEGDTAVSIDRWSLRRDAGRYTAKIQAEDFAFDLTLAPTQPALLNGEAGLSRKGAEPTAASYYYSIPHLSVAGAIERHGSRTPVSGEAWFDHEWSSQYLDGHAVGWDWLGLNLDDGAALMAFRIRGQDGTQRWAGATFRGADGTTSVFESKDIDFEAVRRWTSDRTSIAYPVEWRVRIGPRTYSIAPLLDDQENDTRLSTGAIYWEGAVRVSTTGRPAGRGYLELTGYGSPLKLP